MKKLMTMLAAVALAFGVQAAGSWWEGTSFESLDADTDLDLTSGEGLMWEANGVPKEMKVVDITGATMSGFSRANYYRNETLRRALSVKTNFGEPVFRTNTTEKTMGTLYVDTLVKPTIAEDDSSFTNEAKIAIWFKEVCNSEDIPIATNLMIRAGYIKADGTCVATNYNCGAVTGADEWQRFTIKSFEDITTGAGYPGFVVFRNGRAVQCASDKGDSNATAFNYLDTQPGLYHKYDQLFPSADTTSTTITKIGFDGTGIVDDLLFTDEEEEYAAPFKTFNLAWGANVTGFTYAIGAEAPVAVTGLAGAGSRVLEVSDATTSVIISNVTCAADYIFNTVTSSGEEIAVDIEEEYVELTVTKSDVVAASTATITAKYDAPNVYVTIGGDTKHYIDLAAAFKVVNKATGDVTMQMAVDGLSFGSTTGITLDGENLTSLTIDLNGTTNTFSGSGYAITTTVPLTIIDTSALTNGAIIANNIVDAATNLTINAGIFEGAINITAGTPSITGGKFTGTITSTVGGFITGGTFAEDYSDPDEYGYLPTGYGITDDGPEHVGPYTVGIATYNIYYYDEDGVTPLDLAPATYQFGDDITLPTPSKGGYAFGGWFMDDDPFTYVAGETIDDLYLVASWSANNYTVKFISGEGSTTQTVVKASGATITAEEVDAAAAVEGKHFTGWSPAIAEFPLTVTGDATYTAQYAVDTYNIYFAYGEGLATTSEVQVVNYGEMPVAPGAATVAVVGKNFTGWSPEVAAATANRVYEAQYSAITYTVKFISGEGSTTQTIERTYNQTIASGDVEAAAAVSGKTFTGWDPVISFPYTVTADATFTAQYASSGPAPIDPDTGTTEVEAPADANPKTVADMVEVERPDAVKTAGVSSETYQANFDKRAEYNSGKGVWEVTAEIAEKKKAEVNTDVLDILAGADKAVSLPAGLYYKITTRTTIGGAVVNTYTSAAPAGNAASVSIAKPGTTQGFVTVELSSTPFKQ